MDVEGGDAFVACPTFRDGMLLVRHHLLQAPVFDACDETAGRLANATKGSYIGHRVLLSVFSFQWRAELRDARFAQLAPPFQLTADR